MFGSVAVPAGTTQSIGNVPAGAALGLNPGATGSMTVQYRITPNGPLRTWAPGSVTVATDEVVPALWCAVYFEATGADGFAEWSWTDKKYP